MENYRPYLQKHAKLESIDWLDEQAETPAAATALVGAIEVLVPMAGLIDVAAERSRLAKEIAKLEGGLKGVTAKLSNEKFVSNAPAAVVEKEKQKQEELSTSLQALQGKLDQLDSL